MAMLAVERLGPEAYGGAFRSSPIQRVSPVRGTPNERRDVLFILDSSGSMHAPAWRDGPRRIDVLKDAVEKAVGVMDLEDRVGILRVPGAGGPVLPLTRIGDVRCVVHAHSFLDRRPAGASPLPNRTGPGPSRSRGR